MKELNELKERLVDELKDYGKRELTASNIGTIDTLAHAAKNVCKIIEDDDGYSGNYPYDRGYRGSSYRRDGMGRYSRGSLADKLHDLMDDAHDERTKQEIQRLISKVESM